MVRRLGVIRRIDSAGRVTLPRSVRKTMELQAGDEVEFFIEGNDIIIALMGEGTCVFCGIDTEESLNGAYVCSKCQSNLKEEN